MSSNWPADGGYGADDFGIDPDYRPEGGPYGTDQDGYGWPSATQPYDHAQYGAQQYGQEQYGQQEYGQEQYGQEQYGQEQYDQGQYGQGRYGQEQYGPGQYGQGQYPQDRYGQARYGLEQYDPDSRNAGRPQRDPYAYGNAAPGQDAYGPAGGGTGAYYQAPHGQTPYNGSQYGTAPYDGSQQGNGAYGRSGYRELTSGPPRGDYALEEDSYGRDRQNGYGSARSYRDPLDQDVTSAYQRSSAGDFARQDQGSFSGPDTGSFSPLDTGSFDGRDTGSYRGYDEPDSEVFSRPDTGSFGLPDAGALGRSSPLPGLDRAGGYESWQDADEEGDGWEGDESDGDWRDESDSGLLPGHFDDEDDDEFAAAGGRGGRGRSKRAKPSRRLRGRVAVLASVLAVAVVVGVVGEYGYSKYEAWHTARYGDYTGAGTGKVEFVVPQNSALSDLGPALVQAGVIMEVRPFDSAAAAATGASDLQPGVYLLHHHMSAALAVSYLLSAAHRIKDQVTVVEGLRATQIAQLLSSKTGIPVKQFTQIIDHPPASLGLPKWAGKTAEGFLFPDTYALLPKETALHILQTMVNEFNQQVSSTGANLVADARKVNLTPRQVLVIASLVQYEGNGTDFGKISRLIDNRLNAGMKLQFDSTVFYAMNKYGTSITTAEESYPSPYNTYLHTGLPPGPIDSPGLKAIQAALHPPHGGWLYFITNVRSKAHTTLFTSSYAQFQQWQQEFQG
jgi:uncharacterized YceG family protein